MELDRVYALFSKKCGISEPEYWSLLLIRDGITTQSAISDYLSMSRQTLNSAFKQLQKKEMICLKPQKDDQRTKNAALTEKGTQFVEEQIMYICQAEEEAWSRLTEEERSALSGLTEKYASFLKDALQKQQIQPEPASVSVSAL